MGQIKSANKRHRQSLVRNARNKAVRSKFRNAVKMVDSNIQEGKETADALRKAQSLLQKAASKGVIHKKAASRKAWRLARRVHLAATSK